MIGKLRPIFCTYEDCRISFTPKRKWQAFCSEKCRTRHFHFQKEAQIARDQDARQRLEDENLSLRKKVAELEAWIDALK